LQLGGFCQAGNDVNNAVQNRRAAHRHP
jgi:hypothetical protein